MRLHPVNPAEAIIAPFFDPGLSPQGRWRLTAMPGTRNLREPPTYTTNILWDAASAGELAFVWEWRGQLDLSGYDGFFLQGAFPPYVELLFKARVDGKWQDVFRATGDSANDDYTGSFRGSRLTDLRLEFTSRCSAAGAFSTYYLGVHNQARLRDWLAYQNPQVYPTDWPEFIKPQNQWGELAPRIGLFFDASELESLRHKISQPPYRQYADLLRKQARGFLSAAPEQRIGQYMPCGQSPWGYSARARDRGVPFWTPMELCGFFGLIDRDADLIRMALRHAISLAHVRHWSEGLVEHDFPGSAMNWRSFCQNLACAAMAEVLDWLGGAMTDHAKEVLCHSLYFKGLAPMKFDFARWEYIYRMNQAVVFSAGRMAAILALNHQWPRLRGEIELAARDLDETTFAVIQPDGSHGEGPGYYAAVMDYMLRAYLLLARHRKVEPASLMPPGVRRSADYFGTYVSTAGPCDVLPISDGGPPAQACDWLAMLACVTGDPRWKGLLHARLTEQLAEVVEHDRNIVWRGSSVRTLIHGPADLADRRTIVPTFAIHEGGGHAASRRDTEFGPVYLHLCGSSATEGHSHADKGAFILEAFGEALLIDRGITVYNDPMHTMMKQARLHNLVTPVRPDGAEMDQINPCPKAACPLGHGDLQRLELSIDATPAWDGAVARRISRRLVSEHPLNFELIDELELAQGLPVVFHLHSYAPVEVQGSSALFRGRRAQVQVRWEWNADVISAGVELHDYARMPVYHLALRTPPATLHRLVTRFEISPCPSGG
jgi:hypothetical protein